MISFQNQYADLVSNVPACNIQRIAPVGSKFYRTLVKNNPYWVVKTPSGKSMYCGRETPELLHAINDVRSYENIAKENKAIVSSLTSAGFPAPGKTMSKVLQALSDEGFFRLRSVLIGTVAFQTYAPMFGQTAHDFYKVAAGSAAPMASARTADLDFVKFRSVSVAVKDRLESGFSEILNKTGRFEQLPAHFSNEYYPKWKDRETGLVIDLLTPLVSKAEEETEYLPSLGAAAAKMKFLDFLIYDEIDAAILTGNGIAVKVPQPHRYAIHKLIIAHERKDVIKTQKDVLQSVILLRHLFANDYRRTMDIFKEAWDRGPGWRKRFQWTFESRTLPDDVLNELNKKLS